MFWWFLIGLCCGHQQEEEDNRNVLWVPSLEIPDDNTECSDLYRQVIKNRYS
jgi:hypothetical protein